MSSKKDEALIDMLEGLGSGAEMDPTKLKELMDTLSGLEVKGAPGMVPGYDGEADFSDEALAEMGEEDKEPTIHDLLNEGLVELFGGEEGHLRTELAWLMDPKHAKQDNKIQGRFEQKAVARVAYMSLDGVDDMMFFLDQVTTEAGAWYWHRSKDGLLNAAMMRLATLKEEDDEEQKDQAMMDKAMKEKKDG